MRSRTSSGLLAHRENERPLGRRVFFKVAAWPAAVALAADRLLVRHDQPKAEAAETNMTVEQNVRAVHELFDAWNAHDAARINQLVSEDYIEESDTLPATTRGPQAADQEARMYLSAFPDIHFEIEQIFGSDDFVVERWHATGTQRGELMGIPPTNRRADIHGCSVFQVRDGKFTRAWVYWDTGRMLQQLGVLPGPKSGPEQG
jgi:steroid delta-isomerase-like uncharacterized protein